MTDGMAEDIDLESCPRISRHLRLQWEEAQNAWVLLYPEGMIKLNGAAGEILSRVDGARSVSAIIEELQVRFQTDDLRQDVLDFLEIAVKQSWITL
jgi:pyrroloquinoline quinone biosynthesis protein D